MAAPGKKGEGEGRRGDLCRPWTACTWLCSYTELQQFNSEGFYCSHLFKFLDVCHILQWFKSSKNNLEKCCAPLPVRVVLICVSNIMQPLQHFLCPLPARRPLRKQRPFCFQFEPSQILSRQWAIFGRPLENFYPQSALRSSSRIVTECPWSRSLHLPRPYHTNFLCCKKNDFFLPDLEATWQDIFNYTH